MSAVLSTLSTCRNDVLGAGMMSNTGTVTSPAIRKNSDVASQFRILGGSTGLNSTEYWTINGWDDTSNSTTDSARGEKLFSATTSESGIYFQRGAVKYKRTWGCQIGFYSKPSDTREEHWLHGVCGLEFNWSLYASGHNESAVDNMMLIYATSYSSIYGMPLIAGQNLYSGATKRTSGHDFLNNPSGNRNTTGRISIRGSSSMCNWVHSKDLIFLGLAIGFKQRGNQTIGETQQFRMWNCRPMFSRDGISSSYRAICPGKAYPFSDAVNGYMGIA